MVLKLLFWTLKKTILAQYFLARTEEINEGTSLKEREELPLWRRRRIVGRVISPTGQPLDGKGPITGELYNLPFERKAPGVIFRQPVRQPLQTGIKAIDAMIPIGRGQRELIIVTDRPEKQLLPLIQLLISVATLKKANLFIVFMLP